jgi:hypothetical protein
VIFDVDIDEVSKMYTYEASLICFLTALVYILGSRLTAVDPIPYIEVVAIVCGLIGLRKNASTYSMESRPLTKSVIGQWIQQQVVGIALWLILKFGSLKSIIGWNQANVYYRTLGNHHYAEVAIDDGSRQAKIYVPLLRGRYQIRVAGAPACIKDITDGPLPGEALSLRGAEIPYTTFYSNGYTWSIPVRPEMIGYNKLEFELSDSDNGVQRFEVGGTQLADLQDLICKYQLQIEAAKASSGLAEAYD